jgi:hypothetical protein
VSQALSSGFKEFQIVAILNLKDRCPVTVLYKGEYYTIVYYKFYPIALFVFSINRIRQNASRTVIAVYFNPKFETQLMGFNANTTRQNGGSLQ